MPRFIIACSTSKSYFLAIDAPSKEAADKFYDKHADGVEFNEGSEDGWELNEIYEQDIDGTPDFEVDEKGDIVKKPSAEDLLRALYFSAADLLAEAEAAGDHVDPDTGEMWDTYKSLRDAIRQSQQEVARIMQERKARQK